MVSIPSCSSRQAIEYIQHGETQKTEKPQWVDSLDQSLASRKPENCIPKKLLHQNPDVLHKLLPTNISSLITVATSGLGGTPGRTGGRDDIVWLTVLCKLCHCSCLTVLLSFLFGDMTHSNYRRLCCYQPFTSLSCNPHNTRLFYR